MSRLQPRDPRPASAPASPGRLLRAGPGARAGGHLRAGASRSRSCRGRCPGGRSAVTRAIWSAVDANVPEHELIGRAQAGEVGAFEALAGTYADRLYTVALRSLGDHGEAEDVLQETLLRAWRGIRRFEGRAMVFTWLYRIGFNESTRVLQRRERRRPRVPVEE